jgi:hypothetical protein
MDGAGGAAGNPPNPSAAMVKTGATSPAHSVVLLARVAEVAVPLGLLKMASPQEHSTSSEMLLAARAAMAVQRKPTAAAVAAAVPGASLTCLRTTNHSRSSFTARFTVGRREQVAGSGIAGANLTIVDSGTIAGGISGDGTQADAIDFIGGVNSLTLLAGYKIIGNVVAFSTADTLVLGGTPPRQYPSTFLWTVPRLQFRKNWLIHLDLERHHLSGHSVDDQ